MTYLVVSATGHGSFNILAVNEAAANPNVGHTLVMWTALALLLAIIGKSVSSRCTRGSPTRWPARRRYRR